MVVMVVKVLTSRFSIGGKQGGLSLSLSLSPSVYIGGSSNITDRCYLPAGDLLHE